MNKIKKTIAIILCLVLATSSLAFADELAITSAPVTDYAGHWAESTIQKWMDAGKISGYSDGSYKPDNNITRAEFVKLVDGTIDFNKKATVAYKDVTTADWFYDYVGIAQEIGYISGYSKDSFGPNDYITREQAASILARIQYLNGNTAAANKFSDKSKVSSWAAESVGAAFDAGFITGYNDGTFRPSNNLTRAEALTMLDNVLVNAKNVVIYKDGAELKDKVVAGDLIIAKTVGEGNVYLTNVEIIGQLKVLGGGLNSVYFNNVQVSNVEVLKDKVRLVFADGSVIENLTTGTETVLENTDGTIAKITVSGDGEVTLTGNFGEVAVTGSSNITLDDAVIATLTVSQPITIEGTGTIATLEANANGIQFESEVTITKTVTGEGVTEKPVVVVEAPAGGGGGAPGPVDPTPTDYDYKVNITATVEIGDNIRTLDFDSFHDYKGSAYLTDVLASEINYVKGELTNTNSLVYKAVNSRLGTLNEDIDKIEFVKVDDVDYYNNNGSTVTVNWAALTGTNSLTAAQKTGLTDGNINMSDIIVLLGQYDKTTIFNRVNTAANLLSNASEIIVIGGSNPDDPSIIILDAQLYKSMVDNILADLTATTKLTDVDNTSHSYSYGDYSISITIDLQQMQ